ncbi:MAG TPA: TadE family protein [Gammaproteobacteria bacterium]|nr:TadE family protein [Gammaproteobacteria bacterium]
MSKLLRDSDGSSLVEFTLVFPVLMLVALGTVDFVFYTLDMGQANKAAYRGARSAIVSTPVATGINDPTYTPANNGLPCSDDAGNPTGSCPAIPTVVCTGRDVSAGGGGTCTGGYAFNDVAFSQLTEPRGIYPKMKEIFPRLERSNVEITYRQTGLGFSGRPGGLPLSVTVSYRCLTSKFFFIGGLAGLVYPGPPAGCPAGTPTGPQLAAFATSLPSEDLRSDDLAPL